MEVSRYLFQSPSSSQVQIGRPDPSVSKESTPQSTQTVPNETLSEAKSFITTQVSEVTPTVESPYQLDVYA